MPRTPRTRCAGTMTEAAYWSWLRSQLRRISLRWKPRREALVLQRRPVERGERGQKWEYHCPKCQQWFKEKEMEGDHILGCGSLKSEEDIATFVTRLFAETEGWQWLCKECHKRKTYGG